MSLRLVHQQATLAGQILLDGPIVIALRGLAELAIDVLADSVSCRCWAGSRSTLASSRRTVACKSSA
jgi:hypothetical protein